VVVRTAFVFCLLFLPAFVRGFEAIGIVAAAVILLAYVAIVKVYERNMPIEYLKKTGYINLFGYGLIDGDEDGDLQDAQTPPAEEPARAVEAARVAEAEVQMADLGPKATADVTPVPADVTPV
jgi:hypothetical protein